MTFAAAKQVIRLYKECGADSTSFILAVLDLVEEPGAKKPKKPVLYKPKTCSHCGREFVPAYGAQKMCDDCKKSVRAAAEAIADAE